MSGKFQLHGGKFLLSPSGKFAVHEDCCCAPASCPAGLATCYRIAEYIDGDLGSCVTCGAFSHNTWAGSFRQDPVTPVACLWQAIHETPAADEMNGKFLDGLNTYMTLVTTPPRHWLIVVTCLTSIGGGVIVWRGQKATGQTPVGNYYWTAGCDETAMLAVEACP